MAISHLPSIPSPAGHVAILLHGIADENAHDDSQSEEQAVHQLWRVSCELGVKYLTLCGSLSLNEAAASAVEQIMQQAEEVTGTQVNFNSLETSRNEIIRAARLIAEDVENGRLAVEQITQELIGQRLDAGQFPDPDLIIFTGGIKQLKNCLLWKSAYSEFVFLDECWLDITPDLFHTAIAKYQVRDRRFGGLGKRAVC